MVLCVAEANSSVTNDGYHQMLIRLWMFICAIRKPL